MFMDDLIFGGYADMNEWVRIHSIIKYFVDVYGMYMIKSKSIFIYGEPKDVIINDICKIF